MCSRQQEDSGLTARDEILMTDVSMIIAHCCESRVFENCMDFHLFRVGFESNEC